MSLVRLRRGFTLIELMTVVVVIGVLSTLAVYGVRKYIQASKVSEATSMMSSIRSAEEAFRDETFQYLDVSGDFTDSSLYPHSEVSATPSAQKYGWGAGTSAISKNWQTLGVQPTGPVYFGYAVVAKPAGTPPMQPPTAKTFNFPASPNEPTYVAVAVGDLDGDSTRSFVVSHSFSSEVYVENEGE